MTEKVFEDAYTLDGRLQYQPWVSEAKVKWTQALVEKMNVGDRQAKGLFESLITTSELSANLAHLLNATVIPQIENEELVSDQIAGSRAVSDFRTNYLYTLQQEITSTTVTGAGRGVLPTVPEATPYPEIKFAGEITEGSEVTKRGAAIGVTWEALQNDSLGIVAALPGLFRQLGRNTLEHVVFSALVNNSVVPELAAGETIFGDDTLPNAPLSRDSLSVAVAQLKQSILTNYGEEVRGGFTLIVPVGASDLANFVINGLSVDQIKDGNLVLGVNSAYSSLGGIKVIESGYVTGTEWYLLPNKGTLVRPVLDRLNLIGHEKLELRVENLAGQYVGGGNVHPFEGSFSTDQASWRARQVTGGVLWSPLAVIKSDGTGVA